MTDWGRIALLGSTGLCSLGAQETGLVEKSPFLPPGFNRPEDLPNTAPTDAETVAPSNLRLKGVFSLAGVYRFNLFDTTTGKGIWVAENDTTSGYRFISFDPDRSIARFEVGGRPVSLSLEEPEDRAIPVQGAPPPSQAQQPQQPPAPNAAPPNEPGRRRVVVPPRRVIRPNDNNRPPPPPPPRPRP